MPFAAGETVGSYRLIEQLGQGGMASVFKAYHALLDRYVAIKVLHIAFNEDASFLARFQREARVVARLEHPNIVPIYDFAEDEGRPYLVMKFIDGETLKARLERGRLSQDEILAVLDTVGAALAYAHRQGVLHRDVKPSNVLLAKDGQIYLADFGLARMAQSGESSLTADRLVGTPQYISPEQAVSRADLDARTDIYSFGVMLYELCVGQVPFSGDTPFSIIHDHIYTPLPMPRKLNPDISEAVERVLLKALAKDRDERFTDISALMAAMHAAINEGSLPEVIPAGLPITLLAGAQASAIEPTRVEAPQAQATQVEYNLPSAVPISGASYPPAPSIPATIPQVVKPARAGLKPFWVILGVVALVVAAGLVWTLARSGNQARAAAATQTAAAAMASTPVPGLVAAVNAWKAGNLVDAASRLNAAIKAAGDDPAFYKDSLDALVADRAWLLAGMLLFSPDASKPAQGLLQIRERVQQVHMVLYLSAADPLAGDFLTRNTDKIAFFKVAELRSELLFGDASKAKQALNQFLDTPEQTRLYPEAKLLEVEVFQKIDPAKARQRLDALLKDKSQPDWVTKQAQDLDKIIPK
jgi:predicted Ser/Thr protein kinase